MKTRKILRTDNVFECGIVPGDNADLNQKQTKCKKLYCNKETIF